jgi:acetyl-CoA synthetase
MFESTPMYPDHGRYWDMVQRHKITVFCKCIIYYLLLHPCCNKLFNLYAFHVTTQHTDTAPTAIRSLMRFGDEAPNKYDLSSLKVLGTVGEPINPAAWKWYFDVIGKGKCAVVDTYWQVSTLHFKVISVLVLYQHISDML